MSTTVLVAGQARASVDCLRGAVLGLEIGLGANNKEAAGGGGSAQALEVQKAPIQHIEGTRLGDQLIQPVDRVQVAVADKGERRNVATQVQARVKWIAALVERNGAQGNPDRHRSIVVASRA
ncbi:MAG: hypothetical protein ACREJU_05320 [Nitrospiraceae bacterium]